jgi:tetratricopeptide (TPR) repeat protein
MRQVPHGNYSPVLYQYLKKYQQDPSSRVFAPLAEAYRKAGLVDEAIEIAREGLLAHPSFVGGRVALARALFDKKLYEDVVLELSSMIRDVPDNLVAQRLLAESYLMLGKLMEALEVYKMLLYFMPQDQETSKIVKELETEAYERGSLTLKKEPPSQQEYKIKNVKTAIEQDPAYQRKIWIQKVEKLQLLLQRIERYRTRMQPCLRSS